MEARGRVRFRILAQVEMEVDVGDDEWEWRDLDSLSLTIFDTGSYESVLEELDDLSQRYFGERSDHADEETRLKVWMAELGRDFPQGDTPLHQAFIEWLRKEPHE